MTTVGITGTIGAGKSTVTKMFAELGAFVIDWDQIARQVVHPGKPAWQGIIESFGKEMLYSDGTINRQKLAAIVFNDPDKLRKLNSIIHPEILKEDYRLTEARKAAAPQGLIVKDTPLLIELGLEMAGTIVDKIVVVDTDPAVQLRRLRKKGISEKDALDRINSQIPVRDKLKYADFVIHNSGSLKEIRQQVKTIYRQLTMKESTGGSNAH